MSADALLSNHKASWIFFELLRGNAKEAGLAKRCGLSRQDVDRVLPKMERAGLVSKVKGGAYAVDWDRFVPLFISQAMILYSNAMPLKYVEYYFDRDPENVIEAACARAERELAKIKVKLAGNDAFYRLVQAMFDSLATEVDAPEDFLADLRIQDAVDEFEYALLKLYPLIRSKGMDEDSRALARLLGDWYRQLQGTDNTPTGAALRSAFSKNGLI